MNTKMTILGRSIIDKLKSKVSHRFKLPVPPYADPSYWEHVYKKIYPDNVYEWANITLSDNLLNYTYRLHTLQGKEEDNTNINKGNIEETLGIFKNNDTYDTYDTTPKSEEKILMLGCGTSNLGIDIYNHYNQNINMVQMDVSSKLIHILKDRNNITNPNMEYILDDAMHLNTISNNSISSIIDKGFMDSLYCDDALYRNCHTNSHTNSHTTLTDDTTTINQIMKTMHRALKPNGTFVFFSFSKPCYVFTQEQLQRQYRFWDGSVRVLDLDFMTGIFMYRFVKKDNFSVSGKEKEKRRRQIRYNA